MRRAGHADLGLWSCTASLIAAAIGINILFTIY